MLSIIVCRVLIKLPGIPNNFKKIQNVLKVKQDFFFAVRS